MKRCTEYLEPVPGFSEATRTEEGILLAPVADLVRIKVTSFRMKDQLHLKDLDSAHLITSKVEALSRRLSSGGWLRFGLAGSNPY